LVTVKQIVQAIDGRQVRGLRAGVLIAAAVQAALPVGLYFYIDRNANPMGDGLEWIAMVQALFIFVVFVPPALILGAINRLLVIGALFAGAGALVSLAYYAEIAREFAGHGAR
jgi:hypothetical protein